ncbi:MAG TPA: LLM class flavin-dependent oxidoreductase [Trebonia sp.]|nr:LLM class flavin-dependent oxidoreductase [Trebonia sp.]
MELGLALPQGADRDLRRDVIKVAKQAEQAGFAGLWAYERVLFPLSPADGLYGIEGLPWLDYYQHCADPLTVLTLAGAVTERIQLGTSVLVAPMRGKLHMARALATLDQATDGRVTAGLGSGWSTDEYAAAGVDFARRGRGMDETIDALRALAGPKPVGRIPILLGGGLTPRAVRRIAEKADGWMPSSAHGAATIGQTWKQVLHLAEAAGRDPDELRLVPVASMVAVTSKPLGAGREPFQGSPEELTEDFASLAQAGADEVIVGLDGDCATADELIDKALILLETATQAGLRG